MLKIKATSKNVIPVKAGIHNKMKLLDSRLRGRDKLEIIRGFLKKCEEFGGKILGQQLVKTKSNR